MAFAELQSLPPHDLRIEGRDHFKALAGRFPTPLQVAGSLRDALRALPRMLGHLPKTPYGPLRLDTVREEANTLEIACQAEASWAEYYLGFLEAMVEYFHDCALIFVKTGRYELRFEVTVAPA